MVGARYASASENQTTLKLHPHSTQHYILAQFHSIQVLQNTYPHKVVTGYHKHRQTSAKTNLEKQKAKMQITHQISLNAGDAKGMSTGGGNRLPQHTKAEWTVEVSLLEYLKSVYGKIRTWLYIL